MTTFILVHEDNGIVPNQICTLCGEETEFNPQHSMCDECDALADEYVDSGSIEVDDDDMPEMNESDFEYDYETGKRCKWCNTSIAIHNGFATCDCDLPF